MHTQRLLTAAVLGPLVFCVLWWGGTTGFSVLLLVGAALCLFEYYSMSFVSKPFMQICGVGLGCLPVFLSVMNPRPWVLVPGLFAALFLSVLLLIFTYDRWKDPFTRWAIFFLGVGYVGLCTAHLGLLRSMPLGRQWVLFLLIVIFSGDAGAYYVGHALGKKKLCPRVSKGKTVAGALGGLVTNGIAAFVAWFLLLRTYPPIPLIFLAIFLGAVGQVGDLAESIVKRAFGFKDSGRLLPGHGGVFDRVDAVLIATPVLFWVLELGLIKVY